MYKNMVFNCCTRRTGAGLKVEKPAGTGFSIGRLFLSASAHSIRNFFSEGNIFQFSSSFCNHFTAQSSNPLPYPAPLRNLTDR